MELFMSADADKSGELDINEFKQVLINLQLGLDDEEMDQLVQDCDSECKLNRTSTAKHLTC